MLLVVRLTRIYTRTGDGGETRLADMSVARKTDPRVEAYGDVDETNSALGWRWPSVTPAGGGGDLRTIQNELFDLGADLSKPLRTSDPEKPELRMTQEAIDRLEGWCDEFSAARALALVHPAGRSAGAAQLHVARTVAAGRARRLGRRRRRTAPSRCPTQTGRAA